MYHAVASAHPLTPPDLHSTRCGWEFGYARGAQRYDVEPSWITTKVDGVVRPLRPCDKCWRNAEDPVPNAHGGGPP